MMDINRPVPWIPDDSFDFEFMLDNNETVSYMKDEMEDPSSKIAENYGPVMSEAQVGNDGGAVLEVPTTGGNRFRGFSSKCKENNIRSSTCRHPFMKANFNAPRKKQVTIKDETTIELVASQRMPTQLLPPNLPSNSKRKLLVHLKNEKKDHTFASKRAFPVAGDHGMDGQVSEQPCSQPSTPIKMQLGNLGGAKVESGSKLIQPKSLGTHLSKVSCQTTCSNARVSLHGEDGSDACIILDRFEPSGAEMCPVNRKSLVSLQHSTHTGPINHVAATSVRPRANDERLIYRVALQVRPHCLG